MSQIQTIKDLIALWPTRRILADDLGTTVDRVHKWAVTDSIPAWFHAELIRAAARRELLITADDLVRLHDRRGAA